MFLGASQHRTVGEERPDLDHVAEPDGSTASPDAGKRAQPPQQDISAIDDAVKKFMTAPPMLAIANSSPTRSSYPKAAMRASTCCPRRPLQYINALATEWRSESELHVDVRDDTSGARAG